MSETVELHNKTAVLPTVCPFDCADTCSLSVEVNDNTIVRVKGSKLNPFTNGKICTKVATLTPAWVHSKRRVAEPKIRVGKKGHGEFKTVSWQQAYDHIHQRFSEIIDEHGGEAIVPYTYGGPMGKLAGGSMSERFFNRLGASEIYSGSLCAAITGDAWDSVLGDVGGISHDEVEFSDLIVVWGNNITRTHLHMVKLIRQAQKRGAKLVVIDPKRTRIADDADLFIQPQPGTDAVLAYAVANYLNQQGLLNYSFIEANIEGAEAFLNQASEFSLAKAESICGIDQEQLVEFATLWSERPKALLTMGIGLERTRNGGAAVRTAMALPLLMGSFGPRGAGICDPGGYFNIDSDYLKQPELRREDVRTINTLDLASMIINPDQFKGEKPVKAVFVYNHNPVAVVPNQTQVVEALSNEQLFSVGFDIHMTDTMRYMDVVLPACSPFEYGDLYSAYGHSYTQRSEAVIDPVGNSKTNTQVFRELAHRFGFNESVFTESDDEMIRGAFEHDLQPAQLIDGREQGYSESVFRGGVLPDCPNKKARLSDVNLRDLDEELPRYKPLARLARAFTLVTPASADRINSTFGGERLDDNSVEMHPEDATKLGLFDGQSIRLVNDLASLEAILSISDRVKRGVVYMSKGAWMEQSKSMLNANALIDCSKADLAEGACYYDTQIDVEPA